MAIGTMLSYRQSEAIQYPVNFHSYSHGRRLVINNHVYASYLDMINRVRPKSVGIPERTFKQLLNLPYDYRLGTLEGGVLIQGVAFIPLIIVARS